MTRINNRLSYMLITCIALILIVVGLSMYFSNIMWNKIHFANSENIVIYNSLLNSYDKMIIKCEVGYPKVLSSNRIKSYNSSQVIIDLKNQYYNLLNSRRNFIIIACSCNETYNNDNQRIYVLLEKTRPQQNIEAIIFIVIGIVILVLSSKKYGRLLSKI